MTWKKLSISDPKELKDTRLQLHHAVQLLTIVGKNFIPEKDDDSHTNLEWMNEWDALATNSVNIGSVSRVALRLTDMVLLVIGTDDTLARFDLKSRTKQEGFEWLKNILKERKLDVSEFTQDLHFEMPEHPTGKRQSFNPNVEHLRELSAYFSNADMVLREFIADKPQASAVRCWPHHFDIATLFTFGEGDNATYIGMGMTPGDNSYTEPYFYCNPHPAPKEGVDLPKATIGHWHTEGWKGIVLSTEDLMKESDKELSLVGYVKNAFDINKSLI